MAAAITDAARPGQVAAAVDPGRVDAQRLLDRGDAALAHAHAAAHPDRSTARRCRRASSPASATAARQASTASDERVDHEAPAERGPADAAEDGPVLEALVASGARGVGPHRFGDPVDRVDAPRQLEERAARRPLAARSGPRPPARCATSSGSQPTMFVVRWTRGSSASATLAMTYGGSKSGSQRWALTVKPTTVPRPGDRGRLRRPAPAVGADRARAGGPARRSRCTPGCGARRRRPRSRTTRWPASAQGAVASGSRSVAVRSIDIDVVIEHWAIHATATGRRPRARPRAAANEAADRPARSTSVRLGEQGGCGHSDIDVAVKNG